MLGEDHSLVHDFPELKSAISHLIKANKKFKEDSERYHSIDKEIRNLELQNAPIDDAAIHDLKHERRVLKDSLYQRLVAENKR